MPQEQPQSRGVTRRTLLKGAGALAGLAAVGTGVAGLKIYSENPAEYLKKWGIQITEATTETEREEAYKLRFANYSHFDPEHPHAKAMGLTINSETKAMTDNLDVDPRTAVFLIKKDGQSIGTFRMTDGGPEKGWLIDNVFAPKDVETLPREGAVEASWMAVDKDKLLSTTNILRAAIQAESVLAIEITKTALEHAHKKGQKTLVAPALESQTDFFERVGLKGELVDAHTVAMGKDPLTISVTDLQRMVEEAPPGIRDAVDPEGKWRGTRGR